MIKEISRKLKERGEMKVREKVFTVFQQGKQGQIYVTGLSYSSEMSSLGSLLNNISVVWWGSQIARDSKVKEKK